MLQAFADVLHVVFALARGIPCFLHPFADEGSLVTPCVVVNDESTWRTARCEKSRSGLHFRHSCLRCSSSARWHCLRVSLPPFLGHCLFAQGPGWRPHPQCRRSPSYRRGHGAPAAPCTSDRLRLGWQEYALADAERCYEQACQLEARGLAQRLVSLMKPAYRTLPTCMSLFLLLAPLPARH